MSPQIAPKFKAVECLKNERDGRVYYDIEGKSPGGEEIELDVLMTANGPEIVKIHRDLDWGAIPQQVRDIVDTANTEDPKIARVIASP